MPLSQKKRTKLGVISLYTAFTAALVGSLCGTFAWYTYGARASILYEGSSVGGGSNEVQIGLVGYQLIEDEECEELKLEREEMYDGISHTTYYIYWADGETLEGTAMNRIMEINGYAYEGMKGSTVEKRESGQTDEISLFSNPTKGMKYESNRPEAPKRSYAKFEFVTKKKDAENPTGPCLDHTVSVKSYSVDSQTNIKKGLRLIFSDYTKTEYYLVNPSEKEGGYDIAGGPLDLNSDSYYDVEPKYINGHYVNAEFAYGNFDELVYKDEPETSSGHMAKDECGTFVANHVKDTYAIDMDRSVPWEIHYFGTNEFNNIPLVVGQSQSNRKNYAFFDVTLFLEGWDTVVDNAEAFKDFTFLLEFDV